MKAEPPEAGAAFFCCHWRLQDAQVTWPPHHNPPVLEKCQLSQGFLMAGYAPLPSRLHRQLHIVIYGTQPAELEGALGLVFVYSGCLR